jgi:hypothetical protein
MIRVEVVGVAKGAEVTEQTFTTNVAVVKLRLAGEGEDPKP